MKGEQKRKSRPDRLAFGSEVGCLKGKEVIAEVVPINFIENSLRGHCPLDSCECF